MTAPPTQPGAFLDDVVIPALYHRLPLAFPEFGFEEKGAKYVATSWPPGFPLTVEHENPERLCVYENRPAWIKVHGHGVVRLVDYVSGGTKPTGREFVEAVRRLAELAGVDPSPLEREATPEQLEAARQREERRLTLEVAADHMQAVFWSEAGAEARAYFLGRGFTEDELRDLGLGLHLDVASLEQALRVGGASLQAAKDAGLLWEKTLGYVYLPWHDEHGRPLTLYGRWPGDPPEGSPKTFALPGDGTKASPLFLDRARRSHVKEIVLVEGLFDAAMAQVRGDPRAVASVAAQLNANQLATLKRCAIERAYVCGDPDGGGDRGTEANVAALKKAGIAAFVVERLPEGLDPDEFILKHGIEAWRERVAAAASATLWLISQALEGISKSSPDAAKRAAIKRALSIIGEAEDELDREQGYRAVAAATGEKITILKREGKGQRRRTPPPANGKPVIEVRAGELHLQRAKVLPILATDPRLYVRGHELVTVIFSAGETKGLTVPVGTPVILTLAKARLRAILCERFSFMVWNERLFEHVVCDPPGDLVDAIFEDKEFSAFRELDAVATSPLLRADGSILSVSGYDPLTRTLLVLSAAAPKIPAVPTLQDARAALTDLREAFRDFPFRGEMDRSVALALVLTIIGRSAIDGPVPAFVFTAHTRGSGKTLIAESACAIATGQEATGFPFSHRDEEVSKRITAAVIGGFRVCLIDNAPGGAQIGSASLANAITRRTWSDRILGESKTVSLPMAIVFIVTGNNLGVRDDLDRRALFSHVDAGVERPEERGGYVHDPLGPWIAENRPHLLAAALTILSGYCRAGRPAQKLTRYGSFECWSGLVRSALVWLGEPDPVGALAAKDPDADPVRLAHVAALLVWRALEERSGSKGLSVREALEQLDSHKLADEREVLANLAGVKAADLEARRLGDRLRGLMGAPRNVDGHALAFLKGERKTRAGVATWTVGEPKPQGQQGQQGRRQAPARGNQFLQGEERKQHAYTRGPPGDPSDPADPAEGPDPLGGGLS